jgi:hypothetical protein
MARTGFSDGVAWAPKITVQDKHRSGDGPAEKDFAVTTDTLGSEEAMGAFLDPINNILAATRTKEAHTNSKECFVDAEMTTNRATMKDVEDKAAQRRWNNDEEERRAGL